MAAGPETRLVNRMVLAIKARWPSAWVVKIHGGPNQAAGIPDLLVVIDGKYIGLEAKAQGPAESERHAYNRTSTLQRSTMAKIRRAGGVAGTVLTVPEALELIEAALEGGAP
jgi:hypothetical protein